MVLAKTYVGRERTNENTNGLLEDFSLKGEGMGLTAVEEAKAGNMLG